MPEENARNSRPIYPYSVVRGGVASGYEFAAVRITDAVARDHYRDVGENLSRRILSEDARLYASYRIGDSIYWTSHTVLVRKGEAVLTDGTNLIRGRCGNRLSKTPRQPTRFVEPPEVSMDFPYQFVEEPPLDISANVEPANVPVALPGRGGEATTEGPPRIIFTRAIPTPWPQPEGAGPVNTPEPQTWIPALSGLAVALACAGKNRMRPRRR